MLGTDQNRGEAGSQTSRLFALIADLVRELRGGDPTSAISLSSRLDRDLGIDSLGRTELILRIERVFRVRLPISVMGEADTVDDLLTALEKAITQAGSTDPRVIPAEAPVVAIGVSPATEAKTLIDALDWHVAHDPDRPH